MKEILIYLKYKIPTKARYMTIDHGPNPHINYNFNFSLIVF